MTPPSDRAGLLDQAWIFWAGLCAATLLGACLRLVGLDAPSLWVDEFFTIARVGHDPLDWNRAAGYLPSWASLWWQGAELLRVGLDNIPQWRELGVTEWGARLGPAWLGIVSIPLLGLAARGVVGSGVAAVAVLLLALHPWHIYWSQMARYYTAQFLLANLCLLAFAWGATRDSRPALAGAVVAAVLAYLCHPTALLMPALCLGGVALAAVLGMPGLALLRTAAAASVALAIGATLAAVSGEAGGATGRFAAQDWDASLPVLMLGTVYRIDGVVAVVAGVSALVLLRRRHPVGGLLAAVAILYPLTFFVLKLWFPVAPRYYFAGLFAWLLLAGWGAVEVDRRFAATRGRLAGLSALLALCASLGFGVYLYSLEGAGARERWRDAFAYVETHAEPGAAVFTSPGRFQAEYYLGREVGRIPSAAADVARLPAGSWVVQRSRGAQPPEHADLLELEARYPIPGKPWSWVLYVMRVPGESSRF